MVIKLTSALTDQHGGSIRPVLKQAHSWVLTWEGCNKSITFNIYWLDRGVTGWKSRFEQQ